MRCVDVIKSICLFFLFFYIRVVIENGKISHDFLSRVRIIDDYLLFRGITWRSTWDTSIKEVGI
jgi:hypothetical protein